MPTKGERNALTFLAAVALLGAGTRAIRTSHTERLPPDDAALGAQIAVVDSARARERAPRARGRGGSARGSRGSARPSPAPAPEPTPVVDVPARSPFPIDLDVASREEIDVLPGIGPVLADRIVADRTINGPFGCMGALLMVKGIGPAMAKKLDTLVSFSRPSRDQKRCERQ